MESIRDIYPRYSYQLLETYLDDFLADTQRYLEETGRGHYELPKMFECETECLDQLTGKKAVAASLFCKPIGFDRQHLQPKRDSDGLVLLSELEDPGLELFQDTPRAGKSFLQNYVEPLCGSDFGDWKPLLFLAHDLQNLRPLLESRGIHVIQMEHSSVEHVPGSMWRYLAFNLEFDFVYVQDTDGAFELRKVEALRNLASAGPKIALARRSQRMWRHGEIPLILGGQFLVRPDNLGFDAKRAMLGYIVLNILHETSPTNFPFEPRGAEGLKQISREERNQGRFDIFQPIEPLLGALRDWNPEPPPGDRPYGKCFPCYAFDEQWLKEFVYYELSDGRMATIARSGIAYDDLRALDLEYQRVNGNLIRLF